MAIVCAVLVLSVSAAPKKGPATKYVNATELTMLGKLCETTNPYHRVETESIPELTKTEARLLRQASGLVIAFKTNSTFISVKASYGPASSWGAYAPLAATTGFNLFIKKDGDWMWAASRAHKLAPTAKVIEAGLLNTPLTIINGMAKGDKECLLYLPLYSELTSLEIGVAEGATLEA